MLNPQRISRELLDHKISAQEALDHLAKVRSGDQHQFVDDIVFVTGILNPNVPKAGAVYARCKRGFDAVVEILNMAPSPARTKLVNNLHAAAFREVRSGVIQNDNLPESQKLGLVQLYEALQSRSALSAMYFLSRGMDKGRNDRILACLEPHIDKPMIIAAAVQEKRVDILYQRARWIECLPHLPEKSRDGHFAADLGL